MRLRHRDWIILSLPVFLPLLCLGLLYSTGLSYLYCCARERLWLAARTEAELDQSVAAFYTKRVIPPSESPWGNSYVVKPGERMVRYLIFGKEPLDAVFDRQSRVVCLFTSYEWLESLLLPCLEGERRVENPAPRSEQENRVLSMDAPAILVFTVR